MSDEDDARAKDMNRPTKSITLQLEPHKQSPSPTTRQRRPLRGKGSKGSKQTIVARFWFAGERRTQDEDNRTRTNTKRHTIKPTLDIPRKATAEKEKTDESEHNTTPGKTNPPNGIKHNTLRSQRSQEGRIFETDNLPNPQNTHTHTHTKC